MSPRSAARSIGSRASIQAALRLGFQALRKTGNALDGALAAVHSMEDDPDFNAGTGSSLALNGRCLMDASVMLSDGRFGAVGGDQPGQGVGVQERDVTGGDDHHAVEAVG